MSTAHGDARPSSYTALPSTPELLSRAELTSTSHTLQALKGLYSLIGSSDLIGNPAGLFNDVLGGVKCLYYEPRNGLVKTPGVPFAQPTTHDSVPQRWWPSAPHLSPPTNHHTLATHKPPPH